MEKLIEFREKCKTGCQPVSSGYHYLTSNRDRLAAYRTSFFQVRELENEVAKEKGIDSESLRRMLAKVEEYSDSHRAHGLPDDLLNILKGDLFNLSSGAPKLN